MERCMKVVQVGVPKSGNYLLYRILKGIFHYHGVPHSSFIRNHPIHRLAKTWNLSFNEQADADVIQFTSGRCFIRIDGIFRYPIEDIDDYIKQCDHVWTHSMLCDYAISILKKFENIVYIIRDPRDVAISMSYFVFTPYVKKYYPHQFPDPFTYLDVEFDRLVKEWLLHVKGYMKAREELNIYTIFYERLIHQKEKELVRLLKFLSVDLEPLDQKLILNETSLNTMKAENPHHVRSGKSGDWRKILSDAQKKRVIQLAGPMMEFLGYSIDG